MDEERNAQDIHLYLRHLACTYANTETPLADLEHAIEHDFNMPSGRMKGQLFALKKPLLESKSAFDKVIAGVIAKEPDFEQQLLKIHPLKNKKLKQDAKEGWCTIGPEQLASHDLSAGKRDWLEHLQAHFPT